MRMKTKMRVKKEQGDGMMSCEMEMAVRGGWQGSGGRD